MSIGDEKTRRYPFYHKQKPIYALSLDGVSGSVKVNTLFTLSTFSIGTMCNPVTFGEGNGGMIFVLGNNQYLNFNSSKYRLWTDTIPSGYGTNDGVWRCNNNAILNTKQNVCFTYDSTNSANDPIIYIDGISQAITETQTPDNIGVTSFTNLLIGNLSNDNSTWNGYFYDFYIFNTILTPTQVANLSNGSQKPTDISGCVLYHDYTTGSAQDLSGNGNHGTLMGNAHFTPAEHHTYYSKR